MKLWLRSVAALTAVFRILLLAAALTAASCGAPPPSAHSPNAGSRPPGGADGVPLHSAEGPERAVSVSPFQPLDPTESRAPQVTFISTGAPSTDCQFHDNGPLIIQVPIRRYVGETNPDGTLRDAPTLISRHIIARKARLRLPVFDIDYDAAPVGGQPERDRVTVNDRDLGFLTGSNGGWDLCALEVPIEWLKFSAAPGSGGSPPAEALNEIRIDIDVANTAAVWCTALDWAALSIDVQAPILLVHGANAQGDTWAPRVSSYLSAQQNVFSDDIDLPANGTIAGNGALLAARVQALATQFGSRSVHLVAHGKGGLDCRSYLARHYNPQVVQVLSQYTLSTPHHGMLLPTLAIAGRTLDDPASEDKRLLSFFRRDGLAAFLGQELQDPALSEQAIPRVGRFNGDTRLPVGPKYYSFAADADLNDDLNISSGEASPLMPAAENALLDSGSLLYHLLCCTQEIGVSRMTASFGWNDWQVVNPVPQTTAGLNDLVVTEASARYPGFTHRGTLNRNHSNMKDAATIQMVLNRIQVDYPVNE